MGAHITTTKNHLSWVVAKSGSTMPIFAISLMAIFSLVGATIALSVDSSAARDLQATADSAVLGGATAFITSPLPKAEDRLEAAKLQAQALAIGNSDYVLTDLYIEGTTEDEYGQQTRIVVEMEYDPVNVMAKFAGRNANVTIRRKAAAEATWGFPLCMLSLGDVDANILISGNANIVAENCILWSNSTSSDAIRLDGGSVRTKGLCAAGGAVGASRARPSPSEGCDELSDPLNKWEAPKPTSLTDAGEFEVQEIDRALELVAMLASGAVSRIAETQGSESQTGGMTAEQVAIEEINSTLQQSSFEIVNEEGEFTVGPAEGLTLEELLQIAGMIDNINPSIYADDRFYDNPTDTLKPGTYQGLDISEGHVEMQPGVYIIEDAPLTVRRRATLTGEGVTIILHGEGATFNVLDEARLTLEAPVSGDTAGFALAEDTSVDLPSDLIQRSRLTGSGTINAIGTIYLPRQQFSITGSGAGDQASPLLQIVAYKMDIGENGALNIVYDPSKTSVPVGIKPERTARLVY